MEERVERHDDAAGLGAARLTRNHRDVLDAVLTLLEACGHTYQAAPPTVRRAFNQAWFDFIKIDEDEEGRVCVAEAHRPDVLEAIRTASPRETGRRNAKRGSHKDSRGFAHAGRLNVATLVVLSAHLLNRTDTLLRHLDQVRPLLTQPPVARVVAQRQHQRRLRKVDYPDIVTAYLAGATMSQVGERYGVHPTTIHLLLKRLGVTARGKTGLTHADFVEMARLRADGWTYRRIAVKFDCSETTVLRKLSAGEKG